MKPLVSIVMPVYNGELYLQSAIDSIIDQTYPNFELICVDDGSTDKSMDILKKNQEKDNRVKVVQQKNQYAGVARNNGMSVASGKYLMFLDSDDIFEKNMLSVLVRQAEKNHTDIIFFGFYQFKTDLKHRSMMGIPFSSKKVCNPADHQKDIFKISQGIPWNKFYNREFVVHTGLEFQGLQSNNDVFFSKTIVVEADRLLFLHRRFVNYRVSNVNSLQGSYKLASGNFAKCTLAMYEELKRLGKYAFYQSTFEDYVVESFMLTLKKSQSSDSFKTACKFIKDALDTMHMTSETPAIANNLVSQLFNMILDERYDEAIFCYMRYLSETSVPKSSVEYRLGKRLLNVFRIKNYK